MCVYLETMCCMCVCVCVVPAAESGKSGRGLPHAHQEKVIAASFAQLHSALNHRLPSSLSLSISPRSSVWTLLLTFSTPPPHILSHIAAFGSHSFKHCAVSVCHKTAWTLHSKFTGLDSHLDFYFQTLSTCLSLCPRQSNGMCLLKEANGHVSLERAGSSLASVWACADWVSGDRQRALSPCCQRGSSEF